jgi:hypothetical protein
MNDPKNLRDEYQSRAYILSVFLISIALGVAALSNLKDQYITVTIIEFTAVAILFCTIPFAYKKHYLEFLGNAICYLVGFVLLFNATQIGGVDPGPYVGIIAMLIVCSLLTAKKYSFSLFASVIYVIFFMLTIFDQIGLATTVNIKFQVVYLVLTALIIMNKKYLAAQASEMFNLAKKTHLAALETEEKAKLSAAEATDYKLQKVELEKKNIELSEQTKKLEKMNDLMTGREIEMKKMKLRLKEFEK